MNVVPKRKLFHVGTVFFLLTVVSCVLVLVKLAQLFRNTKQTAIAPTHELNSNESKWEREILEEQALFVKGLGENGTHFTLNEWQRHMAKVSVAKYGSNVYISDRISYNRTIRDVRNPDCLGELYDAELPSASIVIAVRNEVYSVLLRLVWSIINSARRDNPLYQYANFFDKKTGETMQLGYKGQSNDSLLLYIKEIILVDDNSTLDELKEKLDYYVKTRLPPGLIKIVRLPEHSGLIRAKVEGARHATAEVLVFLDSHCEVHIDWLRPLLQNLKLNNTYVLFPIIDTLLNLDYSYSINNRRDFEIGGFQGGYFHNRPIPEEELKRRGSDIALTMSPTMAGGLFAMHRSYFWHLGAYDDKMKNWGGENLEMSFRIWMCGGTIAVAPCSRVAHLALAHNPYMHPLATKYFDYNIARLTKVWLDEYKEAFYNFRQILWSDLTEAGDVSDRVKLREKLKCKSFRWYLKNVYKDKYIPGSDSVAFGRFLNNGTGFCLHDMNNSKKKIYPLIVFNCQSGWFEQILGLTQTGQLRIENYKCVYIKASKELNYLQPCYTDMLVLFGMCRPNIKEQEWRYLPETRQIQSVATKLCLESPDSIFMQVLARECDEKNLNQVWFIEYSDASFEYEHTISPISEEQSQNLAKMAGHRIIQLDIMKYSNQVKKSVSGKPLNITDESTIEFMKKVS